MDPLSIVASVIAVVTASEHTMKGLKKLFDLRHRNEQFDRLWNQTNGLRMLLAATNIALGHIKADKNNPESIVLCLAHIERLVMDAGQVFDMLDRALQKLKSKGSTSKKVTNIMASLTKALEVLQSFQTSRQVHVVLEEVQLIGNNCTQIRQNSDLEQQLLAALHRLEERESETSKASLPKQTENASLTRRSSTASFHSALSSSSESSGTLVSFTGSLDGPEICDTFCPCSCHLNVQSKTPWWVNQMFGAMTLHGNASFLLNRTCCDFKSCQKSGSARFEVSYVAPAWSFFKSMKILYTSELTGQGPAQWQFRTHNTIPDQAPVWALIELGNLSKIQDMLSQKTASVRDVSSRGVSLLKYAAVKGQNEIYTCLLVEKADEFLRDEEGIMAVQPGVDRTLGGAQLDRNVSRKGQTTCELFIKDNIMDQQNFTLLHLIILGQRCLDLEMVLRHYRIGIDTTDANGRSALLWAAWRGDLNNVLLLLKYKAEVDLADDQGWTPLARAANAGHIDVVHCLLDVKASLTMATKHGFQPIHHASGNRVRGHLIVELLLSHGADPNALDIWGATPLHNAANRGSVKSIERLISKGADINATNKSGDTPAMIALMCWNEEAFMHLAASDARLDLCGAHTVVQIAVWTVSTKVWDAILSHRQRGSLKHVDIDRRHDGHDIQTCFETCRSSWYPWARDSQTIAKERTKLMKMLQAFAGT